MFPCFTGVLPEEGYVPAKSKASFLTLSVPTPFPSDQNDPWFSRVRLDLEPRLGLWGVGWVEAWQLVFPSWCHPGTQGKGTLGTWACARCKDALMGIPKGFEFSWWWKNITMIKKLLQHWRLDTCSHRSRELRLMKYRPRTWRYMWRKVR